SRIAPASASRWPVSASIASGQGLLCPISSILFSFAPGLFRSEKRAAIERTAESRFAAHRAIELKLVDVCQEVSSVWDIGRNVVLRVGIKVSLAACNGRHHALVFQAQFPPGFVVTLGIDLAGKNFPTPLIN